MIFFKNNKINNSIQRTIIVECSCGTHSIKITSYDDDPDIYLELWVSSFFTKQQSIFKKIINRIRSAWSLLRGKEYQLDDIIINRADIEEIISALKEIK